MPSGLIIQGINNSSGQSSGGGGGGGRRKESPSPVDRQLGNSRRPSTRPNMTHVCRLLLGIVWLAWAGQADALKCVCNPKECDIVSSHECPGKGLIIWDPCKCCRVCAKTVGEACGGPGGFSGTCEPPLQCVQRLQMKGSGVCLEVPSKARILKCPDRVTLEPGCAIINGKCKCMGWSQTCQSAGVRWDFKNLEECQLNLENLIRTDVDFDEDYPIKVPARSRFRNRSR